MPVVQCLAPVKVCFRGVRKGRAREKGQAVLRVGHHRIRHAAAAALEGPHRARLPGRRAAPRGLPELHGVSKQPRHKCGVGPEAPEGEVCA